MPPLASPNSSRSITDSWSPAPIEDTTIRAAAGGGVRRSTQSFIRSYTAFSTRREGTRLSGGRSQRGRTRSGPISLVSSPRQALQTTALVHEAYLRLVDINKVQWQDRAHFFAVAARVMRRILVDGARARRYQKRGEGAEHVELNEALLVTKRHGPDLVALDDALTALADLDPRKSQVVELRFFGGLNTEEIAEVLNVSSDTILRDWKTAKVWLLREIRRQPES